MTADRPLFLLGTHQPGWLSRAGVPLFVSDTRLRGYKTLPRAAAPWAPDSGGFTALKQEGRWTVRPIDYIRRLRRYRDEIGNMLWAAPQDWMCEPIIINGGWVNGQYFVGTHRFLDPHNIRTDADMIAEHQRRTVLNYVELRTLDASLPIIPVVQGWQPGDYLRCVELYWTLARIDLTATPLVGVGSVCRRQGTHEAGQILAALHRAGLTRLHGFGFKVDGIAAYGHLLASADSMAWSDGARKYGRRTGLLMPGCTPGPHHPAKNCANCLPYALRWRHDLRATAQLTRQLTLWDEAKATA
jgi:hypothetical protein